MGRNRRDIDLYIGMLRSATVYLERHIDAVNFLNVFPVPDGDTGTNMVKTLRGIHTRVSSENPDTLQELSVLVKDAALYEGRGNSGVILSQVFIGVNDGIRACQDVDASMLAAALTSARDKAYQAVSQPVEGTILTVLKQVAEEANIQSHSSPNICQLFDHIVKVASTSVDRTPEQLPILEQGGVVDSGGYGLELILRGMAIFLNGEDPETAPLQWRFARKNGEGIENIIVNHRLKDDSYGHCTQFRLETSLDESDLRHELNEFSSSLIIIGESGDFRVHLHTEHPEKILSGAIGIGSISDLTVQDMELQSDQVLEDRTSDSLDDMTKPRSIDIGEKTAFIAIASGAGVKELFLNSGATYVIDGGVNMNASVGEIVSDLSKISSGSILLVPNHKNLIPAADGAAELMGENVSVLPTESVLEGLECVFEFDPEVSADQNLKALSEIRYSMKVVSIFSSAKDINVGDFYASEGQPVAMCDGEVFMVGSEIQDLLVETIMLAGGGDCDHVTVLVGNDKDVLDVQSTIEILNKAFSDFEDIEVEVHLGNQPHYDFLLAVVNF